MYKSSMGQKRTTIHYLPLLLCLLLLESAPALLHAQEVGQYQYWLELAAADQEFADRAVEIGRTQAFLEFLNVEITNMIATKPAVEPSKRWPCSINKSHGPKNQDSKG